MTPAIVWRSLTIAVLIFMYVISMCASLVVVALVYRTFHIEFDIDLITAPIWFILLVAAVGMLFAFAGFSFGYAVSFYIYSTVLGFVWLSYFTNFEYDHHVARISALASLVAFMVPALFIRSVIRQRFILSPDMIDRLLFVILLISAATIVVCSLYGFGVPDSLEDMYQLREQLTFPALLSYLTGTCISVLLPFSLACSIELKRWVFAGITILLSLAFYPVALTKLALIAPFWILFLAGISHFLSARFATIVSLLAPMIIGLIAIICVGGVPAAYLFGMINFRMLAIPASAVDHYNDFFASAPLTYFCQVSWLKGVVSCPYKEQLSTIFSDVYHVGNYNASMIAIEGVASLGNYGAPLSLFCCGLLIALGNRLSAGLPERFVLSSSGIILQVLMNVGLTTTLLTHGLWLLFGLWYILPRTFGNSSKVHKPRDEPVST
jgi:hypothetical protein